MHLSLLGTFYNNEEMVETSWTARKQQLELYRERILKLVSEGDWNNVQEIMF